MMLIWQVYRPGVNDDGGDLELEERRVPIRRVDGGALDDRRFEDLDLAAVERQAGAQLRRGDPFVCAGIVDLVVEEQLLILADDVREVGKELDAVADERIVGLALSPRRSAAAC